MQYNMQNETQLDRFSRCLFVSLLRPPHSISISLYLVSRARYTYTPVYLLYFSLSRWIALVNFMALIYMRAVDNLQSAKPNIKIIATTM